LCPPNSPAADPNPEFLQGTGLVQQWNLVLPPMEEAWKFANDLAGRLKKAMKPDAPPPPGIMDVPDIYGGLMYPETGAQKVMDYAGAYMWDQAYKAYVTDFITDNVPSDYRMAHARWVAQAPRSLADEAVKNLCVGGQ